MGVKEGGGDLHFMANNFSLASNFLPSAGVQFDTASSSLESNSDSRRRAYFPASLGPQALSWWKSAIDCSDGICKVTVHPDGFPQTT